MKNCLSTGAETASACVYAGRAFFHGIVISWAGGFGAIINIYDNATEAAGKKLIPHTVLPGGGEKTEIMFDNPIIAENGIYVDITGKDAVEYVAYYKTTN